MLLEVNKKEYIDAGVEHNSLFLKNPDSLKNTFFFSASSGFIDVNTCLMDQVTPTP
jgi:hypothetical protein